METKIKELKILRKKIKELTYKELRNKELLSELSRLYITIVDLLSFINPKRKPICIKEK